jgi:hypothetical protein
VPQGSSEKIQLQRLLADLALQLGDALGLDHVAWTAGALSLLARRLA